MAESVCPAEPEKAPTVYRRELMPKGEEENDVGGNQSRESLTSLP